MMNQSETRFDASDSPRHISHLQQAQSQPAIARNRLKYSHEGLKHIVDEAWAWELLDKIRLERKLRKFIICGEIESRNGMKEDEKKFNTGWCGQ